MSAISDRVRQLAPHWGIMFLLMFVVLAGIEQVVGRLSFWASFAVVLVVAFGYPFVVRWLGMAPEVWQRP